MRTPAPTWLVRDFDRSWWTERSLLPLFSDGKLKQIGMCDSSNVKDVNLFRFATRERFSLVVLDEVTIASGLRELHVTELDPQALIGNAVGERRVDDVITSSVITLVNHIIGDAVEQGASDIHLEPFGGYLRVRYRIDGVLRLMRDLPEELKPPTIARLKIIGGLDIAERRMPQDGRIRFPYEDKLIDIRLSTLPTDFGEKAVLRILDKSALRLDLELLGLNKTHLTTLRQSLKQSHGIILVTGPTGSGKTTTLYSALNEIRSPHLNITTIEDPIEYNLEGINQTQIKPEIGLDFAHVLRSVLRQDPNVIMVGEIRDAETLRIALRAAITGHLVLSTLHTNDTVSAIARLLDLGAERSLMASALRLVVAQRLVRLLCPRCKAPATSESSDGETFSAQGCQHCYSSGYVGRKAIFEFLPIRATLAEAIETGATHAELTRLAQAEGLVTLKESGVELAKVGETTLAQIARVTQ